MKGDQRTAAVVALLAEIERLRLTMNADLEAVAGALDADEAAVAAEIIAATASLPMLGHGGVNPRLRSVETPGN
jgi:hypothetical protein